MAYEGNPWAGSTDARNSTRLGGAPPTLSDRVGHTFGKTKEVASTGFGKTKAVASVGFEKSKVAVASVGFEKSKVAAAKIKVGATVSFNWIRLKYKKSKLSNK